MVKVGEPSPLAVPRTQANPELLLVGTSKKHDPPVFLAKIIIEFQARNTPQKRGEPLRTLHSKYAAVHFVADKLGRVPECYVGAHR